MPRRPSLSHSQKQSEKNQEVKAPKGLRNNKNNKITPPTIINLIVTTILMEVVQAQTASRKFNPQSTDTASATNGNITTSITLSKDLFSSPYCQFGDFFGCAVLAINYLNATTQALLFSFMVGIDLQSVKQIVVKNGHSSQQNAASSATLLYTWSCLQTALTYLGSLNETAALVTAQNAPGQLTVPCAWTTPQNQNMYATYLTSSIAPATCALLQPILNGLTVSCEAQASQQAAKLYALIALVAIPVVIGAYFGYKKITTGSCWEGSLICGRNRDNAFSSQPTTSDWSNNRIPA